MTTYSMSAICSVLGIARRTAYYVVRARPGGIAHRQGNLSLVAFALGTEIVVDPGVSGELPST